MFNPNYSITPSILSNLIKTAEARAVVDNAYLVPKWEVALRREALIKNAHASTAIEGNPLSLEQVSDLAMGRDIMVTRKAKAEGVIQGTFSPELAIRLAIRLAIKADPREAGRLISF